MKAAGALLLCEPFIFLPAAAASEMVTLGVTPCAVAISHYSKGHFMPIFRCKEKGDQSAWKCGVTACTFGKLVARKPDCGVYCECQVKSKVAVL